MGTGLGEAIFAQLGTFTYQNNTVYSWRSMARFLGGFFLFGPSDQTEVPHIPRVPPAQLAAKPCPILGPLGQRNKKSAVSAA